MWWLEAKWKGVRAVNHPVGAASIELSSLLLSVCHNRRRIHNHFVMLADFTDPTLNPEKRNFMMDADPDLQTSFHTLDEIGS